jgi:hypothetical protein
MGSCVIFGHPLTLSSINDSNHPLGPGMDVDMPDLHRLRVAPPMPVKGLDHVELQPKELDGVVAVHIDVDLVEVVLALLRSTRRGLETWHGRDGVTLADERARQRGTQTSTYTGAPVLDPTDERGRETERALPSTATASVLDSTQTCNF